MLYISYLTSNVINNLVTGILLIRWIALLYLWVLCSLIDCYNIVIHIINHKHINHNSMIN